MTTHLWLDAITGGTRHYRCAWCRRIIVNPPEDGLPLDGCPAEQDMENAKYGPYYEYMKNVPCIITGRVPTQPHHLRPQEPDEANLIPLTPELHSELHQIGESRFIRKYMFNVELADVARYFWEKYNERESVR